MTNQAPQHGPGDSLAGRKQVTSAMEDYLKAIYRLEERDEIVSMQALAGELQVSGASITNMIKRLSDLKLVRYEPYKGATLTESGRKIALEIVRHHRLLELYLSETLGMPWHEVHAEAERLEHHLSDELEARLDSALGHPTHDPHGDPIPSIDLTIEGERGVNLTMIEAGRCGVVTRVSDRNRDQLEYLGSLGLFPGAQICVRERMPFDGLVRIVIGENEREVTLGPALGRQVLVEITAN